MKGLQVIHPFPARMAPEIVLRQMGLLTSSDLVLDPMCGSGTVLRAGVENGVPVVGIDVDPMAVLMAGVWCKPPGRSQLLHDAHELVRAAGELDATDPSELPWVDDETVAFMEFWFAEEQRAELTKLSAALHGSRLPAADALRVALSRIIITKDRGASLGRDISHSRPHRVATESDFEVAIEFMKSVRRLGERLKPELVRANARVIRADGRCLPRTIADSSVTSVITSPPYLNAIDYLRGHRLSLVWLGHSVDEIRAIRGGSIGVERALNDSSYDPLPYLTTEGKSVPSPKIVGWSTRYLHDAHAASVEIARVLSPGGTITMVVGNSNVRGCKVDNAQMYVDALSEAGLTVDDAVEREIPTRSRYLPTAAGSALAARMRVETVISACKRPSAQVVVPGADDRNGGLTGPV